jgi:putative ABC transport system permease protein
MIALRQTLARLVSFFRKQELDRDFDQELLAHIELATRDHVQQGMTLPEARRLAIIKLGGVEPSKELHRDSRGLPALDGILQDVRFAFRALRRSPEFALTAIATLAIGIGVNAAVFTVTKAALFSGFPMVENNDRVLYLSGGGCCVSYPDFLDWKAQAKSFTGMAIVHGVLRVIGNRSGYPESFDATEVSAGTFQLIGQRPILGRDFTPSDETPGAPAVAMLSYGFWERQFGKDPAIIGRAVRMNGVPTTVIGVMPRGFSFPQKQDLWVPLIPTPEVLRRDNRGTWFVFGRMAAGVTIQSARAEMETIGRRLGKAYPLTNQGRNLLPHVDDFRGFFIDPGETPIYGSMWGAVGVVLLIACANLANLMLARAMSRSREISLRIALGAGRWRIIRQLLIESVMLSSVGGALGWWIAKWSVHAYALADRGPGRSSWRILDYSMDYRVVGYLIAISIGTALLFGLTPALRLSKVDLNATLKDGGRGATTGARGKHLSSLLVMGEVALALVLLAGAGVMIRSFLNLYHADLGVKAENVLTMDLGLPEARYPGAQQLVSFFDRAKMQLEAIPGVESVAIARALPTSGSGKLTYELAGAQEIDQQRRPILSALTIGPDYFRTLGAAVLSGREFSDDDAPSGLAVAIVNQQFASAHWPGENPLGKHLRVFEGKSATWLTVVGVGSNIAQQHRTGFDPVIYLPYRQRPEPNMEVIARTRVPPGDLAAAFRHEIHTLDSDLPIFGPFSLQERLEANYWTSGLDGVLFLILATLALLLASIGLYAVIAHSVSQRTQEIGIRMAVGATARDILKLVFARGMLPLGIGLAVGLAASFAVTPILKSALVEVSPVDPATLTVSSLVLILAAMLGCLIPARYAMRVDPVIALRHE